MIEASLPKWLNVRYGFESCCSQFESFCKNLIDMVSGINKQLISSILSGDFNSILSELCASDKNNKAV